MRKVIKGIIIAICIIILLGLCYFVYLITCTSRIDDKVSCEMDAVSEEVMDTGSQARILNYNVGMGIYSKDFGFFMDGGSEGMAFSEEAARYNTDGAIKTTKKYKPDFICLEETGVDCRCNYHINQLQEFKDAFPAYSSAYAQNWKSPVFLYPLTKPMGRVIAGLSFFSDYRIDSSIRRSLPMEDSIMNFVDLDRCYTKSEIATDKDNKLFIYIIHPSAYTSDGVTASRQVELLMKDMKKESDKGNYCIAAGDWNRDLIGNSGDVFGVPTDFEWTRPFDNAVLPEGYYIVSGFDEDNPIPTGRNAEGPYDPDTQVQVVIDGFIVSGNVEMIDSCIVDTGFEFSDHNPVYMDFILK